MSQHAARHDPRAKSEADEDVASPQPRPADRRNPLRPRRPADQPDSDGHPNPDEPDDGEFELIGDNDLGPADLGPADPHVTNPDSDSGRIRKIS